MIVLLCILLLLFLLKVSFDIYAFKKPAILKKTGLLLFSSIGCTTE